MWHEARKQEKKIRDAMVDFQRRAERRREHYDKMRGDPNQFLRLYGSRCQLHINPLASRLSSSTIPWQGDNTNMISRYDVRINLDHIPDYSKLPKHQPTPSEEKERQKCNYERYRFLVFNQFKGLSEEATLAAVDVEDMGVIPGQKRVTGGKEKAKSQAKAAIGYHYGDGNDDDTSEQSRKDEQLLAMYLGEEEEEEKAPSSESEYEVDIDVDQYRPTDVDRLNLVALGFGIAAGAFSKCLRSEKQQMVEAKLARQADLEKSALTGKKARKERKQLREQQAAHTRLSTPPTYAQRDSPTYEPYEREHRSRSSSCSSSPGTGQVEYITEFGGDRETRGRGDSAHQSREGRTSAREGGESRERGRRGEREGEEGRRRPSYHRSPRHHSPPPPHNRHYSHSSHYRSRRYSSRSRSRDRRHRRRSQRSRSRSVERRRERSSSWERDHTHTKSRVPSSAISGSAAGSSGSNDRGKSNSLGASTKSSQKLNEKVKEKPKLTPQERLKKKMQSQLTKQFKQDKKLQKEKELINEAKRIEREEEMKEHVRKMRDRGRSQWEREDEEDSYNYRSRSTSPHGYGYHDYY